VAYEYNDRVGRKNSRLRDVRKSQDKSTIRWGLAGITLGALGAIYPFTPQWDENPHRERPDVGIYLGLQAAVENPKKFKDISMRGYIMSIDEGLGAWAAQSPDVQAYRTWEGPTEKERNLWLYGCLCVSFLSISAGGFRKAYLDSRRRKEDERAANTAERLEMANARQTPRRRKRQTKRAP